jgi:hypothetical protein
MLFETMELFAKVKGDMPGIYKQVNDLPWSFLKSKDLEHTLFQEMFCIMEVHDVFTYFRLFLHLFTYLLYKRRGDVEEDIIN